MNSGRARRAVTRWFRFSANRRRFRRLLADRAIIPLPVDPFIPPSPSPPPSPPSSFWNGSGRLSFRRSPLDRGRIPFIPPCPPPRRKPVGPPQCRYGRNHRKENQNQDVDQDQSRNDRKASAARLEAAVGTGALNGAEEPAAVGRARALASLRRWRQGFTHRQGRREAAGLAEGFRDHVLLLRHHESWKASTRQGKAAAAVAAATTELGRRARMRRALLDLARGVEDAVERREVERPRLRQAFGAWADLVEERAMERYQREEERMGRDRWGLSRCFSKIAFFLGDRGG